MEPLISSAKLKISLSLSGYYSALLYCNIKSIGSIRYHHLLVIEGACGEKRLIFGSEWNGADQTYKNEPMLGVFNEGRHRNFGESVSWLDDTLFVLEAFRLTRKILDIKGRNLAEGEAWALSEITKKLKKSSDDEQLVLHLKEYEKALSKYDKRLISYKKATSNLSDSDKLREFNKQHRELLRGLM